jgi:hypothetical protein
VIIVFYCDSCYRASLLAALDHLGILGDERPGPLQMEELSCWAKIQRLKTGQFFRVGEDHQGNQIFIVSVNREKSLLPKIITSLCAEFSIKERFDQEIVTIDALPQSNLAIFLGKNLASIPLLSRLAGRLMWTGILFVYRKRSEQFPGANLT